METEDIKTILLSLCTIEKSREIIVEILEKVEKFHFDDLTENGRHDIHGLDIICQRIKVDTENAENCTENMKDQITASDEEEIEEAVLLIEDILLDVQPPANTVANQMAENALAAAAKTERALYGRV